MQLDAAIGASIRPARHPMFPPAGSRMLGTSFLVAIPGFSLASVREARRILTGHTRSTRATGGGDIVYGHVSFPPSPVESLAGAGIGGRSPVNPWVRAALLAFGIAALIFIVLFLAKTALSARPAELPPAFPPAPTLPTLPDAPRSASPDLAAVPDPLAWTSSLLTIPSTPGAGDLVYYDSSQVGVQRLLELDTPQRNRLTRILDRFIRPVCPDLSRFFTETVIRDNAIGLGEISPGGSGDTDYGLFGPPSEGDGPTIGLLLAGISDFDIACTMVHEARHYHNWATFRHTMVFENSYCGHVDVCSSVLDYLRQLHGHEPLRCARWQQYVGEAKTILQLCRMQRLLAVGDCPCGPHLECDPDLPLGGKPCRPL